MLFQTLICRHGSDSPVRFALISLFAHISITATQLFSIAELTLLSCVLLLPILGLSCLRRLSSSAQASWLVPIPTIPFLLLSIVLAYSNTTWLIVLMTIFSLLASLFILSLKDTSKDKFQHFGYSGPVISSNKKTTRIRVEPVIDSELSLATPSHVNETISDEVKPTISQTHSWSSSTPNIDKERIDLLLQQWVTWIKKSKKILYVTLITMGILIMINMVISLFTNEPRTESDNAITTQPQKNAKSEIKFEQVDIPDGLSLILTQQVLTLRWLGESYPEGEIWSQASAKGDKSCSHLIFNNGSQYRPLTVVSNADTSLSAIFSPLDTAAIIKDVAMRGSIKFCGYQFSLKGSQAALSSNSSFVKYL